MKDTPSNEKALAVWRGLFWDSTQFPEVAARYSFSGRGVYRFTGVVEEEFGHVSLRTLSFKKLPWKPDPRYGGT